MKPYSFFCSVLLLLWFPLGALGAGDPTAGQAKSQACVACHGNDGNSVNPVWPKIAGQYEAYLVKQLKEMRLGDKGPRFNPVMLPTIVNLSDQDFADLAAYYAKQKPTPGSAAQVSVARGEQIYRGGNRATQVTACIACHGPEGAGNEAAHFPRLSGQHSAYTQTQLRDFRDKKRTNSTNNMMETISHHLSEEEIKAVSDYIEGLH